MPYQLNVAVGNPTLMFASALRVALERAGISAGMEWDIDDLEGPLPDRSNAQVLLRHRSRPLREIVRPLLKDSINLYAEAVMRLNVAPGQPWTNDAALEGFVKRLTAWGVPPAGQQIVDGSGLSRRDTVSADTVLMVLRHMHDPAGVSPFVTALPVAGVDGTLSE